jgi:aminomethyltransferase
VRRGALLFRAANAAPVGVVTSGGFGPSFNAPISMGYVSRDAVMPNARLSAEVRGKRLPVKISKLPFMPTRYKRLRPLQNGADA